MASEQLGIDGLEAMEEVGRGGFGVVYRARQPHFNREVAVKILSTPKLDDEARRRFERECAATGSVSSHPHIVGVLDSGISDQGRPYIVMEYMPQGSLAHVISSGERLAPDAATAIGVKLAGALETAHRNGILHRDLKPENVLVSPYGEPCISDFGIARVQDGTETRAGVITASLAHAPPEVLEGAQPAATADVYSLASTLYTLLLGRAPFHWAQDEGFQALVVRIATQPPPDLREAAVPEPIAEVLERAMDKSPGARHATAEEFGLALAAARRAAGLPEILPVIADARRPAATLEGTAASPTSVTQLRTPAEQATTAETPAATSRHPRRVLGTVAAAVVLLLSGVSAFALTRPHSDENVTVAAPDEAEGTTSEAPAPLEPTPSTTATESGEDPAPAGGDGVASPGTGVGEGAAGSGSITNGSSVGVNTTTGGSDNSVDDPTSGDDGEGSPGDDSPREPTPANDDGDQPMTRRPDSTTPSPSSPTSPKPATNSSPEPTTPTPSQPSPRPTTPSPQPSTPAPQPPAPSPSPAPPPPPPPPPNQAPVATDDRVPASAGSSIAVPGTGSKQACATAWVKMNDHDPDHGMAELTTTLLQRQVKLSSGAWSDFQNNMSGTWVTLDQASGRLDFCVHYNATGSSYASPGAIRIVYRLTDAAGAYDDATVYVWYRRA